MLKAISILSILLAATLLATSSSAIINENENVMGLYFDEDGDSDCLESVAPLSQLPCYIVLTNPTYGELYGFEVGYEMGSELMVVSTDLAVSEALNVGSDGNLIVGFGTPLSTSEATHLATLNLMYMDMSNTPTHITLRGTYPSSIDPAYPSVLLADGEIVSTEIHQPRFPHHMNGICTFVDHQAEWGEVKSLYR